MSDAPDLPVLSPLAPALLDAVVARLPLVLDLPGGSHSLALDPAATAPDAWHGLSGTLGNGAWTLRLDPALLPPLLAARWPGEEVPGLTPDLRAVAVAALLPDLLDRAEAGLGVRPDLDAVPGPPPPHALLLRGPDGAPRGVLRVDDAVLRLAAARLPPLGPRDADPPVRVAVRLDRVPMPRSDLRALAAGDIVLLDVAPPPAGAPWPVRLVAGGAHFRATLRDGTITLLGSLETPLDDETPAAATLDAIPLPVEAVLGAVVLPLSRLRDLQPGTVLDLGDDALRRVALRVHGTVVATGEVVRIGERAGVRLLTVIPAGAAP